MAGFDYQLSITGDCNSTGAGVISILPFGGTPPYTVQWFGPPSLPPEIVIDTEVVWNGLYAGTYIIRLNDSSDPVNADFFVNAIVSSGCCVSIIDINETTCGTDSGSVTASATTYLSSVSFALYTSGGTLVNTFDSNTGQATFTNLSAGTYYIEVTDPGGCTSKTADFIILESNPLSFGLYLVPNSACSTTSNAIGKIYVTGQTGTPPYTYLWNTNATGSTVTGLTSGFYSVTVTDANGCTATQNTFLPNVEPLGLLYFSADTPSCFNADGSLTMYISGGTAPYYYSASTGNVEITYAQNFVLSGIPAGTYSFLVTDAGLCQILENIDLQTPQSIGQVTVNGINSTCSLTDGQITISVSQGNAPFTYTLVYPDSTNTSITKNSPTHIFDNLTTGDYTVIVSDQSDCVFTQDVSIFTQNTFTIVASQTGTTCNLPNGVISITKTPGGVAPYDYFVDGVLYYDNTSLSSVTINNISGGSHLVSVVDAQGCTQTQTIYITPSQDINFSLFSTDCGNGSDGTISAFITSGTPPYTFNWSSNVPGNPQQISVGNLTAGTYSLTVIDSNGCSLSRTTTISCAGVSSGYVPYKVGSQNLVTTLESEVGILEMLNDGFQDLTNGNPNCDLVTANFIATISVNPVGLVLEQSFYTGTTLVDIPAVNLWYNTVENLLITVPGVQSVDINPLNNQITITKNPSNTYLNGQIINIALAIEYDINC